MARAQACHQAGRLAEAATLYETVLSAEPGHAEALHFLGMLKCQSGDWQAGKDFLQRALDAAPARADFKNNLGVALMQEGQVEQAIPLFKAAAAADARYVDAFFNLGNALSRAADWRGAAQAFSRTVKLRPDHRQAWVNLAKAAEQDQNLEGAEAALRRALSLNDKDPGLLVAHARLLVALERPADAHACLERALRLQPDNADALNNLANLHKAAGDLQAAVETYRRAIKNRPGDAVLHNNLGVALSAIPSMDDARAAFEKALAIDPGFSEARNNLGLASRAMGAMEEAATAFRKVIETRPRFAPAYYNLIRSRRVTSDDPEPAAIAAMLEDPEGFDPSSRVQLHFALAKAQDDLGRPELAFPHYVAGSAIHRSLHPYDLAAALDVMDRARDAYDPEGPVPGQKPDGPVPVFVVGMPRSGTSLVEQMLSCHPGVFGVGECVVLPVLTRKTEARLGAGRRYPECLVTMSGAERAREGEAYLDRLGDLVPVPAPERVVDKLPSNFLRLGWIAATLPQARIVHCVRDPRDVCLSCFQTLFERGNGFAYDLETLGRYYGAYAELMRHWHAVTRLPIHDVSYEGLVTDTETTARALLEALGIDWDPAVLDFHKARRPVLTASATQVRQPLYTSAVGRWRRYEEYLGPLTAALEGAGVVLDGGT